LFPSNPFNTPQQLRDSCLFAILQLKTIMPNTCTHDSDLIVPAFDANAKTSRVILNIHPRQARIMAALVVNRRRGKQGTSAPWVVFDEMLTSLFVQSLMQEVQ